MKVTDHPGSSSSATTESTQPGGAADSKMATRSQTRVKKENDYESKDGHSHHFTVKFSAKGDEYTIDCDQPRTVLEVIKSSEHKDKMENWSDENIIIQLGKKNMNFVVATHFPCSCIDDGESLILSHKPKKVEKAQDQHDKTTHSRDNYSVFYIDTQGGEKTKSKKLFRHNAFTHFKFLCVYGEKEMTVEEALKRDGRFTDYLGNFDLIDNNAGSITARERKVDKLDQNEYKIRLLPNKQENDEIQQETPGTSNDSQRKCDTTAVKNVAHQKGISVRAAVEKKGKKGESVNTEEVYEILREQFPCLKEWMESRFPGDSFQEELNLRRENFGKIQQLFSEVHRVRKLIKLGESVCKVVVENISQGTGFVLFDNFILTNTHLFKGCVEEQQLKEGVNVLVLFNYEDPDLHTKFNRFPVKTLINYSQGELDYVILELNLEIQNPNQTTRKKKVPVPPGLLKKFGPVPPKGEACIIGHPAGGMKKMDPTCIIEKKNREQAVNSNLADYKDYLFTLHAINQSIKTDPLADLLVTYNTFMYHGSSGSPVFDAKCQVFGLHSGGFFEGFPKPEESVIEFAFPLLLIFKDFVRKLKERRDEEMLKRVERAAKGNEALEKVLVYVCGLFGSNEADNVEPADTELMDTD